MPVLGSIEKQDVAPQLPVGVMKSIAALRIMKFALSEVRLRDGFLSCS